MKIRTLIHLVFLAGILASCNRHDSRLADIDAIMEADPTAALAQLDSIRPEALSPSDHAYYGMLLTQARYKNFIDEDNDSLIMASAEYFLKNDMHEKAALALFQAGIIQMNAGRLGEAAVSMTKGLNLARNSNSYKTEGYCARGLFKLYVQLFDGSKQILYAKEAYNAFLKGGYDDWVNYAALDVATAYNNNGNYQESIDAASRLLQTAKEISDTVLMAEAAQLIGLSQFASYNNMEAIRNYTIANSLDTTTLTDNDKSNLMIAISQTQPDSIPADIQNLIDDMDMRLGDTPSEVYAARGDYEEAYKSLKQYKNEQDSVLAVLLRNDVSESVNSYEQGKEQLRQEKIKNERLLWGLIILIVLILCSFIIFILRKNMLEKQRQQEEIIRNAEAVKTDLLHQIKLNDSMSESVKKLFKDKYSIVNTLCAAYYESENLKLEKKRIIVEVEQIIQDFADDNVRFDDLVKSVDKYNNGIYSSFRDDFPKLKAEDYQMFLYLIMGFSARSISLFFDERIEVIYNRKSRLKAKIRNSSASRKDEYLSSCETNA